MFLGIVTLFVAFCISGIAAYYSIVGLTAIFAAAFVPIVLMGVVLEIGKLISTIWLKIHWQRAPKLLRTYLVLAVFALMFITSMGIFGFLSKSHIEQSSVGQEQLAQAAVVDDKIARSDAKISRWKNEIERLNRGETSGRIDALISREQKRIRDANARLKPEIDAENAKIPGLRAQAQVEVEQQNKRLKDAQQRSAADIKIANDTLAQLDKDVEAYTSGGVKIGTFSDTDLVAKGAELRRTQKPERDAIQAQIARAKKNEIGVASRVQREIRKINNKLGNQIKAVEVRIAKIRESIAPTIESANANIAKYTLEAGSANKNVDSRIAELETNIENEIPIIDTLREDRFVFEKKYRQFEAEVGPVKYIAELIYGEADRTLLEAAVRWVIIIIVAVFDPLAVCLVLAGTMAITWWREERARRREEEPDEKIVVQPDPRVEELEMELQKHNEIIDELEKLLDSNLGNVNPLEYAKLKEEYDNLMSEKAELETLLAQSKGDAELLASQIVTTEAERDEYKAKVDELSGGVEGFQSRIEELLTQISNLEDEVDRRDAVVVKMAEKYQLVEKDEFAEGLESEVEEIEKN
jgi:chromosome segregation ATPase